MRPSASRWSPSPAPSPASSPARACWACTTPSATRVSRRLGCRGVGGRLTAPGTGWHAACGGIRWTPAPASGGGPHLLAPRANAPRPQATPWPSPTPTRANAPLHTHTRMRRQEDLRAGLLCVLWPRHGHLLRDLRGRGLVRRADKPKRSVNVKRRSKRLSPLDPLRHGLPARARQHGGASGVHLARAWHDNAAPWPSSHPSLPLAAPQRQRDQVGGERCGALWPLAHGQD